MSFYVKFQNLHYLNVQNLYLFRNFAKNCMKRTRKIISKLRNTYRLTILNDNSLGEVFSIKLTPLNVLMLFSSLLLVFTLLIFLLVAYTPVRNLVPGYGKGTNNANYMELNQKYEDLKRQMQDRQEKLDAVNNILSGNEGIYDSAHLPPKKEVKVDK